MLGKIVRESRETLGMNQKEFADMVGIVQSHVSMIEKGKRKPKLETLDKIAVAIGVDVETLIEAGGKSHE